MATMKLPTPYQEFIFKRSYARWLDNERRRETWAEAVGRYSTYFWEKHVKFLAKSFQREYANAIHGILTLDVMPSMRCMWTAGPALDVDNVAGFNCAYTTVRTIKDFAEILYILMNGTGIGVSVERQFINDLPLVPPILQKTERKVVFEDSKRGWAEGFQSVLHHLFLYGQIPQIDTSKIRPKGARLKTFGGRASGPEPLRELVEFTIRTCLKAQGRRLTSEEVADIVCKTAEIVIVGGVRRSAVLLLTNPSDRRMANFKAGEFWIHHPHRALANISACYTDQPDPIQFTEDFLQLMKSGTGERGIVNRVALQRHNPLRNSDEDYGLNPCGEIVLKPKEFCNLSEIVVRPNDGIEELLSKARSAAIFGILQATLTSFQFISSEWTRNTEEERLLGVSLTGLMDNRSFELADGIRARWYDQIRQEVQNTANRWANALAISRPKGFTCVKPSGTVSQLVNASSGLHPRFARYYIRRVRVAITDPVAQFLRDKGIPWQPEIGETIETCKTAVFEFPQQAPPARIYRNDVSAIYQLEYWKSLKLWYTDHNPSCTIYVRPEEWLEVGGWLYKNWGILGGITLLPYDGGIYKLAPYEEISETEYLRLTNEFPQIDFSELNQYEKSDETQGAHELACVGGACEL